ncbi:hypothetical protein [Pseudomonas sp. NPDC089401]|uniref:hypothetical protein n=1 Tax=Pseudomonas sp. NPDC089401 TaxID=3364462 RepID=UPI00381802B1
MIQSAEDFGGLKMTQTDNRDFFIRCAWIAHAVINVVQLSQVAAQQLFIFLTESWRVEIHKDGMAIGEVLAPEPFRVWVVCDGDQEADPS